MGKALIAVELTPHSCPSPLASVPYQLTLRLCSAPYWTRPAARAVATTCHPNRLGPLSDACLRPQANASGEKAPSPERGGSTQRNVLTQQSPEKAAGSHTPVLVL